MTINVILSYLLSKKKKKICVKTFLTKLNKKIKNFQTRKS